MTEKSASPAKYRQSVYLLYGDDRGAMLDFASGFHEHISGDPGMRDLNTTRLEGKKANVEEIQTAAYALPFLAERRLVIVDNPFKEGIKSPKAVQQLLAVLDGLPSSSLLALIVDDTYETRGKKKGWQTMQYTGKLLLEWAEKNPSRALVKVCRPLPLSSMPGWIIKEAGVQHGKITPQAAAALAAVVGSDTGQARQEIIKLLTYLDYQRQVSLEDVQELVASGGQANVFAMLDAMALGNAPLALRHLGRLLEEEDSNSLFGMIVRQFRLLILTKEAVLEGIVGQDALVKHLKAFNIQPFAASILLAQSKNYSLTDLEGIYHRLFEVDKMVKTGQTEPDVALQTFVAGLTV